MQTHTSDKKSDCNIHMRVSRAARDLIDSAAHLKGKTRTAFILECSEKIAEEILLDQTRFLLDEEKWHKFIEALDQPSSSNERLKKLFQSKSPWE